MTYLYLVRHGETDWNKQGRVQGSTDIPLNDTGRAQAAETGRMLSRRRWDAVVSSPLSRARETGAIIARVLGIEEPTTHPALVERHYGNAEGMTGAEIDALQHAGGGIRGRESVEDVVARVTPALLEIAAEHEGQSLVVTTHGAVIRAMIAAVDPSRAVPRSEPIVNGSVHSFRVAGDALELLMVDDRLHDARTDDEDQDPSVVFEEAGAER